MVPSLSEQYVYESHLSQAYSIKRSNKPRVRPRRWLIVIQLHNACECVQQPAICYIVYIPRPAIVLTSSMKHFGNRDKLHFRTTGADK
jgi:hypothetical protein